MLKLAFYRAAAGRWWDKVIAARTGSPYSHVELVFPERDLFERYGLRRGSEEPREWVCFSASPREGCARFKHIDLDDGKWDVVPVSGLRMAGVALAWEFCRSVEGSRYDWPGVISVGLSPLPGVQIGKWWWCGEVAAEALHRASALSSLPSRAATPMALSVAVAAWNEGVLRGRE